MSWGNKATLTLAAGVPLQLSESILHQGRWWQVIKELDMEGCIPISYPQWSCYCDSVPWEVMVVIQSAIWWHLWAETSIPLPNACNPVDIHSHYMLPEVFTHPQWTLWWMATGEFIASLIHPREVFLAWCWVIARPLTFRGIVLLSLALGSRLNWGGAGTSVPCLADTQTQGNTSFWWNEKSLHMRGHPPWSDVSPHEACPPTCP